MVTLGAGEIAQLVDRFIAFAEDQNIVPSTQYWVAQHHLQLQC